MYLPLPITSLAFWANECQHSLLTLRGENAAALEVLVVLCCVSEQGAKGEKDAEGGAWQIRGGRAR